MTELSTTLAKDTIKNSEVAKQEYITAVSPTKMNVLYIGVDNPVSIAVTGAENGKITAEIDNGKITGENGNYIVRVQTLGVTTITVKVDEKIITQSKFRVKRVPDPIAIINGIGNSTELTKEKLLNAGGIAIVLLNFDFDLRFDLVEFTLSAFPLGGFMQSEKSTSYKFSKPQIELINSTKSGDKIYIEDIQAKGPDGTVRNLGSLVIKII